MQILTFFGVDDHSRAERSVIRNLKKGSGRETSSACVTDLTSSYLQSVSEYSSAAPGEASSSSAPRPSAPPRARRPQSAGAAYGAFARRGVGPFLWRAAETIPENEDEYHMLLAESSRPVAIAGDTPRTTCVGNWGRRNVEGGPIGLRSPADMSSPRKHWTMVSGTWPARQRSPSVNKYQRWGENWAITQ